jgi:phytoene dehydrogenase-like protein
MSRIVVIGAGVGGLTAAIRLAEAGHEVEVHERSAVTGGKLGVYERDGFRFDTGPSLLTLPQVFSALHLSGLTMPHVDSQHDINTFADDTEVNIDAVNPDVDSRKVNVDAVSLDPVVRHVFPDGTVLDSSSSHEVFLERISAALGPEAAADWDRFWRRAARIWRASWRSVLRKPVTPRSLVALSWRVGDLVAIAPGQRLRSLGRRYLRDPRLLMMLDRYATYTGADPRRAPAALAAVPYAELHFGGWYLRGGLGTLGSALTARCAALGVRIVLNSEVTRIETADGHVRGVRLAPTSVRHTSAIPPDTRLGTSGPTADPARTPATAPPISTVPPAPEPPISTVPSAPEPPISTVPSAPEPPITTVPSASAAPSTAPAASAAPSTAPATTAVASLRASQPVPAADVFVPADVVVSNVDALTVYRDLLPTPARLAQLTDRSLAGFVLLLGVRGETPSLAHHTVFFPRYYDAEFDAIFGSASRRARPASDPTIFVTRAADPAVHPEGREAWFVLVNAPRHGTDWSAVDWRRPGLADAYGRHILDVLARRGLDVRDRVEFMETRTPADLADTAGAPGGAIYGTSGGLIRPVNRGPVDGLYLVGGSVHPGGGLPMVTLSAQMVADEIGPA